MKQRIIYIVIGLVIGALAAGATGYYFGAKQAAVQGINSYDECVAGYPVMDSYPEQCRTPDGRNFTNTARVVEQPVVFEGKIVCLPHVNTDGPQTLECMSGLQTNDGKYYLLGSGTSHELISAAGSDKNVRVSGVLKPGTDAMYQSEGTITVQSFEFL